jgi:hypothetical protein
MTTKTLNSKKETFLRLPIRIYSALVNEAATISVERGASVTVQRIIIEILESWLKGKER